MLQERLLVRPDYDDLGLVSHQPDGSWLRHGAVSEVFLRRVRRYGLPRLTMKGLRHTWATLALETERFRDVILETLPIADMLSAIVTMHPRAAVTIGTAWELADSRRSRRPRPQAPRGAPAAASQRRPSHISPDELPS